jgi:hypothetical protein
LCEFVVALDLLGVGDKFLVDMEESGLVEDGEERRPLLEVNVDAAIGEEARRDSEGLLRGLEVKWFAALDM